MKGRGLLLINTLLVFLMIGSMLSCAPKPTVMEPSKEKAPHQPYVNMKLTPSDHLGRWTKTDIYIPKGAIVAVMAKGEIWDIRNPGQWRWQPCDILRFKIGEEGRRHPIDSGIDKKEPYNLNVVPGGDGGFLYFGLGAWWKMKDPRTRRGEIRVRVLIWEKDRQDKMESDLLNLIRSHPEDHQIRDLVGMMAICFGDTGDYQKVQNLYKMIKENSEWDWERVYPIVLNQLSDFERKMGRYETARTYLEESLRRVKRYNNQHMEWLMLRRSGMLALSQKKYDEAGFLFQQALQLASAMNNPSNIGATLNSIGLNLLRMNKPEEAVAQLEEALRQLQKHDRHMAQRWTYLYLGEGYLKLNRHAEAKKSFESAIEAASKAADPEPQWSAHRWLGILAEQEGNHQMAFEHYAKAIAIVETMRAKYTDPSLKALFMRDKHRLYERMIQLLYRMQRTSEAFHYLERARARVMLDMLAEKALSSRNREENELLAQERALRRQMEEASMREEKISYEMVQETEQEREEARDIEKPLSGFDRLQARHRAILERIERLNPELASLVTINPLKASEIQSLLETDTALLEYFIGVEGRYVFVITSQKVLAVPLKVDARTLFEKIREFRRRAVEGITLDRLLTRVYERPLIDLHEILMKPVMEELSGKKHLVIVPHGMLHYLPFQALLSKEGRYLIESFTISYLPSASVLKYARAKNRGNRSDLFAVGNPTTGLPPLPAAEVEVKEVSTLFEKNRVLTGEQATKTAVKGEGSKFDLILLSTHGEMINSDPLKSNLRFTPSGRDDGKLTVSEIFDLEIKANLVTLSACETGLVKGEAGDFPQGDDLVGLSRAFIHAGAPSVVASLWKVSDDSTVQMMKNFYQNMRTLSKAEALRKAQLDLMKSTVRFTVTRAGGGVIQPSSKGTEEVIECSHPFFWAPFILLGDWK